MAELMDHVRMFADQIGPRPVSTEEENSTSLYVANELTDEGLDVSVDEFATPTSTRWPYVVAFVAAIVGTVVSGIGIFTPTISLTTFVIGFILIATGVFIYYSEINNKPVLSKTRAGGVSQNVVARYVPSSVRREQRRRKIIIVAHVDTVRAEPECMPALIQKTALLRRIIYFDMIGLLAVTFVRLLPLPWPETVDLFLWIISIIGCVYLLLAAGCIVARRFMPYISGGNDNASSVAVLLAVARLMLNPEERTLHAMKQYKPKSRSSYVPEDRAEEEEEYEEEPAEDSEFAEEADDVVELHDPETIEAAGVIPEGATIEFTALGDDDAAATTVIPAVDPEAIPAADATQVIPFLTAEQLAARKQADDQVDVEEVELDDSELDEELIEETFVEEPKAEDLAASQEIPVVEAVNPVIVDGKPVEQPAPEAEPEPVVEAAAPAVAPLPIATPAPVPAPEFVAKPAPVPADDGVPSWYKKAKARAAKETGEYGAKIPEKAAEGVRSRFANIPVRGSMSVVREEVLHEEEAKRAMMEAEAAKQAELAAQQAAAKEPQAKAAAQAAAEKAAEAEAAAQRAEQAEAEVEAEAKTAAQPQEQQEPITFDILDDELELTPDASGLFAPVTPNQDKEAEGEAVSQEDSKPGLLKGFTSRIPVIGSSDNSKDHSAVHPVRDVRLDSALIPVISDEEVAAKEAASEPKASRPKPKPERRKPTARHITQEFQPTKPVDERDNEAFSGMRQKAAVSSVYESTPQAGPEVDPFAPSDMTSEEAFAPTTAFPSVSASAAPSSTSSFPALSGSMPVMNVADFGESDYGYEPSFEDVADDFTAPAGMTGEINIPESRLHGAMDKIGGLFGRKGKKRGKGAREAGYDNFDDGDVENWDEGDGFGWKGGAYYSDDDFYGYDEGGFAGEPQSALEAAKARAAEIRDSVIQMTENDLLDKEVWFVALGASSANNQGMKNFLELHASELRGSLIINLEAVGTGEIRYVDYEGTGKSHRSDRRLQSLVRKASKELMGSEMRPQSLEWRNTDATPAMLEGMRAMSIMGFEGVAPACWHWTTDTIDVVEEENLNYVTSLLLNMIENS